MQATGLTCSSFFNPQAAQFTTDLKGDSILIVAHECFNHLENLNAHLQNVDLGSIYIPKKNAEQQHDFIFEQLISKVNSLSCLLSKNDMEIIRMAIDPQIHNVDFNEIVSLREFKLVCEGKIDAIFCAVITSLNSSTINDKVYCDEHLLNVIRGQPGAYVDGNIDCLGFVLKTLIIQGVITETMQNIFENGVMDGFKYLNYSLVSASSEFPLKGDIILYLGDDEKMTHIGIIADGQRVNSKWGGIRSVLNHPINTVPSMYGSHYLLFRKESTK